MNSESIAVIIPCYNEALTIGKVIDDFHRELPQATVYVYDNNSSDDTSRIATEHGATVRFEPRQGKGNVCRQMFRDIDADCYLMVDGDDTYPAEAAKALCEPILSGTADMTVGDRLSNGTYAEENKRAFRGLPDRNRALNPRRRPPLAHQRCAHRVPRPSGRLRVQAQYRERRH